MEGAGGNAHGEGLAEPWLLVGDAHSLPQFPHLLPRGTGWAPRGCLGSEDGKSWVKTGLSLTPKVLAEAFPAPELPLAKTKPFLV